MSNVLKVNSKTKVNVQLFEDYKQKNFKIPSPEELIEKKIQKSFEEGYAKGFADGKEETKNNYQTEIEKIQSNVQNILTNIDKSLSEVEKSLSKKVFMLSVSISEKIILREVENKSIIEESIKKAFKKLSGAVQLTVKVSQQEFEFVKDLIKEENQDTFRRVNIESDERLQPGECVVESEIGNVSTRFDAQLEEIVKDFEKYYSGI